jgi:hypothetical protein
MFESGLEFVQVAHKCRRDRPVLRGSAAPVWAYARCASGRTAHRAARHGAHRCAHRGADRAGRRNRHQAARGLFRGHRILTASVIPFPVGRLLEEGLDAPRILVELALEILVTAPVGAPPANHLGASDAPAVRLGIEGVVVGLHGGAHPVMGGSQRRLERLDARVGLGPQLDQNGADAGQLRVERGRGNFGRAAGEVRNEDRRSADVVNSAEHEQGEVADRVVQCRLLPVARSHGRHRREPGCPVLVDGRLQAVVRWSKETFQFGAARVALQPGEVVRAVYIQQRLGTGVGVGESHG